MTTPNEKLAAALEELRRQQADGSRVLASEQLSRLARQRLLKHGFLQEVMKGWVVSSSPDTRAGDTTPWFASFWEFCRRYCGARFRDRWHLSAAQSLLLHAENTVVPRQVIIQSPRANNNRIDLPFGCSFFALKEKRMPDSRDLEVVDGLRVLGVEAALVAVSEDFFTRHPVEAQLVLRSIREPSGLLSRLLAGGRTVVAGRLVGALRRVGSSAIADELVAAMRAAEHDVRESDPFEDAAVQPRVLRAAPPIVQRLQGLWATGRGAVLDELPGAPGLAIDHDAYLQRVDDVYKVDAYHSLSIEGYQVTPELVQRVSEGSWDPTRVASDRDTANALAARGYWLAFQRVREVVRRILVSGGKVELLRTAHRDWYRELFGPNVAAGLLTPAMLAGYRNGPVFIRGSRHVPPRSEALGDAMPALFDLIEAELEPAVRAVLGHWLFGYVHPFPDGNGRLARFLMNTLLAGGGYPWTVIRVEDRAEYLSALETASVDGDVRPFARFVAGQMRRTRKPSTGGSRTRSRRIRRSR